METEDEISCKVVLVGENYSGKNDFISYISASDFRDDEKLSGAMFSIKVMTFNEFNGRRIRFEILDSPGKGQFRTLARLTFKNADVIILIYDITRKESFDEIKKYWYKEIREYGPRNVSKKKSNYFFIKKCSYWTSWK